MTTAGGVSFHLPKKLVLPNGVHDIVVVPDLETDGLYSNCPPKIILKDRKDLRTLLHEIGHSLGHYFFEETGEAFANGFTNTFVSLLEQLKIRAEPK